MRKLIAAIIESILSQGYRASRKERRKKKALRGKMDSRHLFIGYGKTGSKKEKKDREIRLQL
jgi:hypothetical protein